MARGTCSEGCISCRSLLVRRTSGHHGGLQCFLGDEERQELGSQNQLLKIFNYLKSCSASFPWSTECISAFHPEILSVDVESQQLQQQMI